MIEDLHNVLDASITSSSHRSTSSKTHSFHSLGENRGAGSEEAAGSAREEEHCDSDGDQEDHGEGDQVSDNEPDYSIKSIDSIESQHVSNQDDDYDHGAGQHDSGQDD